MNLVDAAAERCAMAQDRLIAARAVIGENVFGWPFEADVEMRDAESDLANAANFLRGAGEKRKQDRMPEILELKRMEIAIRKVRDEDRYSVYAQEQRVSAIERLQRGVAKFREALEQ